MKNPKKRPTIYDLSVLSGASPSTVSAVLNGSWQKRRIKASTAEEITELAEKHQYTANRQARALRVSQSGLVGLIVPIHDSRIFSSMAQAFEGEARRRGLTPVVVSTLRDPAEEVRTVETLISYQIDALLIAGATEPDAIHDLCEAASLAHVNVDLPGTRAPSVITDNFAGAVQLTEALLEIPGLTPQDLWFIGGNRQDFATSERIRGFRHATNASLGEIPEAQIVTLGYAARQASATFEDLLRQQGRLPRALFVNCTSTFEGLLRCFAQLPATDFADFSVGCYDYDPFASFLHFPVTMVRQDVQSMIRRAFDLMDEQSSPCVETVAPLLVRPRTALPGPLDSLRYDVG